MYVSDELEIADATTMIEVVWCPTGFMKLIRQIDTSLIYGNSIFFFLHLL